MCKTQWNHVDQDKGTQSSVHITEVGVLWLSVSLRPKKPVGKDNIITVKCLFCQEVKAKLFPPWPEISVPCRIIDDLIVYTWERLFQSVLWNLLPSIIHPLYLIDHLSCPYPWSLNHPSPRVPHQTAASHLNGQISLKTRSIIGYPSLKAQTSTNWLRVCSGNPCQRTRQLLSPLNESRTHSCGISTPGTICSFCVIVFHFQILLCYFS